MFSHSQFQLIAIIIHCLYKQLDDSLHNVPLSSGVHLLSHCPHDPN